MSEDEAYHFWCMIDDEQTAFSVNASPRWNVEELTKAIRQERPRLQTVDIVDLVLWKVRLIYILTGVNVCAHLRSQLNDPIPVDDDDDATLPQLLSKPITDFSVKLGKRTQKLSDVFSYLPKDHLHIIVKLAGKQIDGHLCLGD